MSKTKDTQLKPESFEAALARLEEIANLLEDGEAELAKSLELYKEGAGLAAWCTKQLDEARQQVKILSRDDYFTSGEENDNE